MLQHCGRPRTAFPEAPATLQVGPARPPRGGCSAARGSGTTRPRRMQRCKTRGEIRAEAHAALQSARGESRGGPCAAADGAVRSDRERVQRCRCARRTERPGDGARRTRMPAFAGTHRSSDGLAMGAGDHKSRDHAHTQKKSVRGWVPEGDFGCERQPEQALRAPVRAARRCGPMLYEGTIFHGLRPQA